jgi:hypothetical protein
MKLLSKMTLITAAMFAAFFLSGTVAARADTAPAAKSAASSAQDIADAKSKGLVWVNTNTKVYHKSGQFYGKTKHGKFMTEVDAQKAGYKAAQEPGGKKKSAATDIKNK